MSIIINFLYFISERVGCNYIGLRQLCIGGNNLQLGITDVIANMDLPNLKVLELSRSNRSASTIADLAYACCSKGSLKALMFYGITLGNMVLSNLMNCKKLIYK